MRYTYNTKGTCATTISFELEDGVVHDVQFSNGCDGNLKAIAALVEGMTAEQIRQRCTGITCGRKQTSCADQLTRAIELALEEGVLG